MSTNPAHEVFDSFRFGLSRACPISSRGCLPPIFNPNRPNTEARRSGLGISPHWVFLDPFQPQKGSKASACDRANPNEATKLTESVLRSSPAPYPFLKSR